jgi:hypothetical protein
MAAPRSVANVYYSDGVPDHSIKDFVANCEEARRERPAAGSRVVRSAAPWLFVRRALRYGLLFSQLRPNCQTGCNRRRFGEDRRWLASNIRPSCLTEQGESRLHFLIARGFPAEPFIDRRQFVWRRVVVGAGEFGLDFQRNLCQLLLPVLRPGSDPMLP